MRKSLRAIGFACFATIVFALAATPKTAKASIRSLSARVEPVIQVEIPAEVMISYGEADGTIKNTNFDILVTTNNRTGYTLSGLASSRYLTNTTNSSSKLDLRIQELDLTYTSNTWMVKNDAGIYLNTTENIFNATTAAGEGDVNHFVFNTTVNASVASGIYAGNVNFYAVANPVPKTIGYIDYLQEIDNDVVMSMKPGKYYELKDSRDQKKYWIVFDGTEVSMAQNLDYNIDSTETLAVDDSNVPENIQLINTVITGGDFENSWISDSDAPQSYDEGNIYKISENEIYANVEACTEDGYSEWECKRAHVGNRYNWSAAVAMNDTSVIEQGGDVETVSQSICPAA